MRDFPILRIGVLEWQFATRHTKSTAMNVGNPNDACPLCKSPIPVVESESGVGVCCRDLLGEFTNHFGAGILAERGGVAFERSPKREAEAQHLAAHFRALVAKLTKPKG